MKKTIAMHKLVGGFAENKDIAKSLRVQEIIPFLSKDAQIIIDFDKVEGATQSFVHALLSDPIRQFRDIAFDNLSFKNANADIREIISIVYRYMQESIDN